MLSKNQEAVGVVSALGSNGEGIIKEEGFIIFLPFTFLGEKVHYKILKVKKNFAFGKVLQILEPSADRVAPICPVYFKCGGCQLQHIKYDKQLELKSKIIKDNFYKIAGIDINPEKTIKSDKILGYRNKLQLPVTDLGGKTVIGFYSENSHYPIEISECPITEWSKQIIYVFKEYIEKFNIKGYNESNNTGELRHIVCRGIDNKFIITVVSLKDSIRGLDFLIEKLKQNFDNFSLYINVNNKSTNVIFGEKFILKYGPPRYTIISGNIKHEFGAESFLQVNREVSEQIYSKVVELSAIDNKTTVIDAYSGAGLMTAMLALKAKKAIGIEIIKEAVVCADSLAKINGLQDKMQNICGKCEEILPEIIRDLKKNNEHITLILDPPRKGVDEQVIKAILACNIEKIIYVSCNPATLARDVGLLCETLEYTANGIEKVNFDKCNKVDNQTNINKYNIEYIRGYDMFPQTKHVETLVCLSKKNTISHIDIDMEFGENKGQVSLKEIVQKAEEQKPKEKVTYKMIQQYVEEKYDFKVHTAYIAEVKRSFGLPMYDAPNAVEERKREPQHPTPKMVKAIKEALKFYEII